MRSHLATAICLCLTAVGIAAAQTFEVSPNHVMPDDPAVIRVKGLEPKEKITIEADLVDGAGEAWSSSADFVADDDGAVDASKQAPVSGSYKVISSMGLLWSMMPKEKRVISYRLPKELGAQSIQFRLLRNGRQAASAHLEQISVAGNIKLVNVQGTLHGVLYEPASRGPHPGVLVLGGSNGGYPGLRLSGSPLEASRPLRWLTFIMKTCRKSSKPFLSNISAVLLPGWPSDRKFLPITLRLWAPHAARSWLSS